MRIYLAGPMRGIPEFNFPAFDAAAKALRKNGHEVFNPAERDRSVGFSTKGLTGNEDLAAEGFSLREALAADTEYISKRADAVALLPNWENSSGVAAEIALARALGLPVAKWDDLMIGATHGGPASSIPEWVLIKSDREPSGSIVSEAELIAKVNAGELSPNQARAKLGLPVTNPNEVRTTSATGGEKGTKPERYDLIPVEALSKVAALYGRGAAKYAAHNWRRGYEWSKSYAALQRHATQFWAGEDNDTEMDLPHMASVAFHALALLTFMEEQRGFDDRYTREEPAK